MVASRAQVVKLEATKAVAAMAVTSVERMIPEMAETVALMAVGKAATRVVASVEAATGACQAMV